MAAIAGRRAGAAILFTLGILAAPLRAGAADPYEDLAIFRAIGRHRERGEFEPALEKARGLLETIRADSAAFPHEIKNREVLVATLEKILSLPPAARAEIAEADRLSRDYSQCHRRADYDGAARVAERQLLVRARLLGARHHDVGVALTTLGIARRLQGRFAEADSLHRAALQMYLELLGPTSSSIAMCRNFLGGLREAQGNYAEAEDHYRETVRLFRTYHWENESETATALANLAQVLRRQGKLGEAEGVLGEALSIRSRASPAEDHHRAEETQRLAAVYREQGSFAQAEALLRSALDVQRRRLPQHPVTAGTMTELARVIARDAPTQEAEALLDEAEKILRRAFRDPSPEVAGALIDRADFERRLGRNFEAEPRYRSAIDMLHRSIGQRHPEEARALRGLGAVCRARGHYDEAISFGRAALGIRARQGAASAQDVGLLIELGDLHWAKGDVAGAAREYALASRAFETSREAAGSAIARATFQESPDVRLAVALLTCGREAEAWEPAERYYGRVLEDIRGVGLDRNESRPTARRAPIRRVQSALEPGTAMVGWVELDSPERGRTVWGWVLRDRGPVHWIDTTRNASAVDPSADPIAFREMLTTAGSWPVRVRDDARLRVRARSIGRERFRPLETHLAGVERIIVIPSKSMAGTPVEVLEDADGRLWGDRCIVSYAPSATAYVVAREHPKGAHGPALVVGAQAGGAHSLLNLLSGEIDAVARALPGAVVVSGEDARESNLARLSTNGTLQSARTLHFALHATANAERPDLCALAMVPEKDAEHSACDGFVTMAEVARDWKLDAELVTLAGCGTGLGRPIPGEGFLGFAHAILGAGARDLVTSLWEVDDAATARLMAAFYEIRARDPSEPARALRDAKIRLREYVDAKGDRPYSHPSSWAAFILWGDGG